MARTKQTARKTTGGKRPRAALGAESASINCASIDAIVGFLRRAAEHDPLAVGVRLVPVSQKKLSTSGQVGTGIGLVNEWAFPNVGTWVADYLDPLSVIRCRLTCKKAWKSWIRAMEGCVGNYFLMTTDMKRVAEERVEGGWIAFIHFMAQVGVMVQKSFDALLLRPPALYRAMLGQQALRRIDGSPHPPILQVVVGGSSSPAAWKCDVLRKHGVPCGPRVVPSLSLCFGSDRTGSDKMGDTWFLLPQYDAIPNNEHDDIPNERLCSSDTAALLESHVTWVAEHGKDGSIRQWAASDGRRPFVFLAQDGSDTYASFVLLTLDDDDQPVVKYFSDYQLEGRHPSKAFVDVGRDVNSVFFTFPYYIQGRGGEQFDIYDTGLDKYNILMWAAMVKGLRISPFEDFDVDSIKEAIQEEEEKSKRPSHYIFSFLSRPSYDEMWRQVSEEDGVHHVEFLGEDLDSVSIEEVRDELLSYFARLERVGSDSVERASW